MRWSFKKLSLKSKCGQERIVVKFLFKPRKFFYEWRWLESTYIKEECKRTNFSGPQKFNWVEQSYATEVEFIQYYDISTGECNIPINPSDPACDPNYSIAGGTNTNMVQSPASYTTAY